MTHTFLLLAIIFVLLILSVWVLWRLSQPKYFYLIRHGETLLNKEHIKQGADGALSEKGIEQAEAVGKALKDHGIQKILTSPYERAVQTATIMQKALSCPIEINDLLRERKNASEVIGKKTDDPEVVRITSATAYGYHENEYRFSDEENFTDLKIRARKCLRMLQGTWSRKVVVVTHHAFLQMLLSYITVGESLHANDYVKMAYYNPAKNAGITLCVYHPHHGKFKATRGWEIVTYSQAVEFEAVS